MDARRGWRGEAESSGRSRPAVGPVAGNGLTLSTRGRASPSGTIKQTWVPNDLMKEYYTYVEQRSKLYH